MRKTKIFISQPMHGKTDEEILEERQAAINDIKELHESVDALESIEIIDSFIKDKTTSKNPALCDLAYSLRLLAEADLAIFLPGWKKARGCKIERAACLNYGINTLTIGDDD